MPTRVYRIISSNKKENDERINQETDENREGNFEVSAHSHRREDGKNEVHFKGKMTLKDEDYYKYISKYGHHFSKKLAEHMVEELITTNEKIPYDKVEEILKQSDEELEEGQCVSDLYYAANMIKARHSHNTIKSDAHVVMLAIEYLNNPNEPEGELFCDWFDGLKRKNKTISWDKFM